MKSKLAVVLMSGIVVLALAGCGQSTQQEAKQDVEDAQQELEQTIEEYGTIEQETAAMSIAKLNAEVMDNGLGTPVYDDYIVADNGGYWAKLTEDIVYKVQPVEFTGDREADITDISFLHFNKANCDEEIITKYVECLIKANDDSLTDEQVAGLIRDAREDASLGKTANVGTGISVGMYDDDEDYVYEVIRLYE